MLSEGIYYPGAVMGLSGGPSRPGDSLNNKSKRVYHALHEIR